MRPRAATGRPGQLLSKPGGGQAVYLEQRLAAGVGGRVALRIGRFRHLDAEAFREQPHRFGKREFLVQLDELHDIAPGAAAEALEEPLVLIHVERRRLLVVERTQTLVRAAGLLQGDDVLNDLDDVGLRLEVVDELGRKASHGLLVFQLNHRDAVAALPALRRREAVDLGMGGKHAGNRTLQHAGAAAVDDAHLALFV